MSNKKNYSLDLQVGFLLRKALQQNSEIFSNLMPEDLTPTRFAAMAKLKELGGLSQNELGRQTAMDVATIKGVVGRLVKLGLVSSEKDPSHGRKHIVKLTPKGEKLYSQAIKSASKVSSNQLNPLNDAESRTLLALLKRIG